MIKRSLLTFLALQVAATGLSWACTCSQVTRYADHERVFVGRARRRDAASRRERRSTVRRVDAAASTRMVPRAMPRCGRGVDAT